MTLRNRVLPTGEICAISERGLFMGNRGILHDDSGTMGTARWRHKNWICCLTEFRGRKRLPMSPGMYTELFFMDEAVALAAGHRPCAECRRVDYQRYRDAWAAAFGHRPLAPEMDRALHSARVQPRTREQRRHMADFASLPDGTFVRHKCESWLVLGDSLRRFTPAGYDTALPRPQSGEAEVMTPAPSVAVLAAGYRPQLHPSAF